MNRYLQFMLFFTVFFTVIFGLNYYILSRLSFFFEVKKNFWFYLVWLLISISFIIANLLERISTNIITKGFYAITASWIGVGFFFVIGLVIYDLLKLVIKINPKTYGVILVLVVIIFTIFSIVNALLITVKSIEVPIDNLDHEVKIIQMTDLHVGSLRNSKFVENVVKITNEQNPDFIVITGDLVDSGGDKHKESYIPLKDFKKPAFFITGNHERYNGINTTIQFLKESNIKILRNEMVIQDGIQLIGVDDPEEGTKITGLENIKINPLLPTVLLRHQPSYIKEANELGVDLQLSGHTHNGQLFPFNFIVGRFFKYVHGLHNYNGTYIYVSPGTGTWGPPLRFGSRNEITLITLKPK